MCVRLKDYKKKDNQSFYKAPITELDANSLVVVAHDPKVAGV